MSKCLTLLASTTRHPALMDDAAARDVLWWLADLAHDRNGGRISPGIERLAQDISRSEGQVRRAVARLLEAGILEDTGEKVGRDVRVYMINAEVVEKYAPGVDASRRAQRRIANRTSPQPRHNLAMTSPQPRHNLATTSPPMGGDKQEQEQEQEQENTMNAGAPEDRTVGEPATAEATAAEARVQAAIEALLPDLHEYHLAKARSTASARIVAGWRAKLATRLADDGVTAERIDARVLGVRAVLRWWRLPVEAAAQPGEPFCFYQPDLRSVAKLLDTANHLDKLIGWAAEPRRKPGAAGGQPTTSKRTRGGVELGAPRYELETNPDGTFRW